MVLCISQNFLSSLSFLFPLALPVQHLKYALRSSLSRGVHPAWVQCKQGGWPCEQEERLPESNTLHWEPPRSRWFQGLISNPKTETYEFLVPLGLSGTAGDQEEWGHLCSSWSAVYSAAVSFSFRLSVQNLLGAHRVIDPLPLSKHTKVAAPESPFRRWQILIRSSGSKTATVTHFFPCKTEDLSQALGTPSFTGCWNCKQILEFWKHLDRTYGFSRTFLCSGKHQKGFSFICIKTEKILPKTASVRQTKDVANFFLRLPTVALTD